MTEREKNLFQVQGGFMHAGDFICYSKVKMKVAGLQQSGG